MRPAWLCLCVLLQALGAAAAEPNPELPPHDPSSAAATPDDRVARDATERIALDYSAPRGCDTRDGFFEQVRAYTERAVLATPAEAREPSRVRRFEVEVTFEAATFKGTLTVASGADRATRDFAAATCPEVVQALALAMALAIDPESLAPARGSAQSASPPDHTIQDPGETPRERAPSFLRFDLLAAARAHSGLAPDAMAMGPAAAFELSQPGFWQHAVSLGAWYGRSSELGVRDTTLRFASFSGRAQYCPLRLGRARASIEPCLALEVGPLAGERLSGPRVMDSALTGSAQVALRGTWHISRFFLRARGDLLVAWLRPEFRLDSAAGPDPVLFHVPVLSAALLLGAGVRFGL